MTVFDTNHEIDIDALSKIDETGNFTDLGSPFLINENRPKVGNL